MDWINAHKWEKEWHGDCVNTFYEEQKQLVYAVKMGLKFTKTPKTPYVIDLQGRNIVDIGGGPSSLLLKTINGGLLAVIDPILFPDWVISRYEIKDIVFVNQKAEVFIDFFEGNYDEVWIYNCLQHTEDPEKIIWNAKRYAGLIRIFEWIDTGISEGHIHNLMRKDLDRWLNGEGKVEEFNNGILKGKGYYGIFPS